MAVNRYVVDTSAYSHFNRGDRQVIQLIDSALWLGIPSIVVGELEVGFLLGMPERIESNRETLQNFLDNPAVEELGIDQDVSRAYAEIVVALRRNGVKLPTNDIWIAAIATRHGATVLTYDKHFRAIDRIGSTILTPPDPKN